MRTSQTDRGMLHAGGSNNDHMCRHAACAPITDVLRCCERLPRGTMGPLGSSAIPYAQSGKAAARSHAAMSYKCT